MWNSTQVCLVAFTKGKMTVLASAFDRNLGGISDSMLLYAWLEARWGDAVLCRRQCAGAKCLGTEQQAAGGPGQSSRRPVAVESMI